MCAAIHGTGDTSHYIGYASICHILVCGLTFCETISHLTSLQGLKI